MVDAELHRRLDKILGPNGLLTNPQDLSPFSSNASRIRSQPCAVLLPQTSSQVAEIVRLAHDDCLRINIRGAGTGLDGAALATKDSLLLSTAEMSRIVEISPEDMVAVVQPGVIVEHINEKLRPWDLFYPPEPASRRQSTIGGGVATRAHGLRGAKYGLINNYLLGLEAVVSPGEVVRCGARTLKCATGYHLTDLFAGSRGRIGVITEITLKLVPKPQARASLMAAFGQVALAIRANRALVKAGIWPSRSELMDAPAVAFGLADLSLQPSPGQSLLLMELDGPEPVVVDDADRAAGLLTAEGAGQVLRADGDEAEGWWRARDDLLPRLAGQKEPSIMVTAIIPSSKTLSFFRRAAAITKEARLFEATYGHLGEGRWHLVIRPMREQDTEIVHLWSAARDIQKAALSLGGRSLRPDTIGFTPPSAPMSPADPGQQRLWRALKARFDPVDLFPPLD